MLAFASIDDGAPSSDSANAVVTLTPASAPAVRREVRYLAGGQVELGKAYGWGAAWTAGRK